jgi:hypothetical protein
LWLFLSVSYFTCNRHHPINSGVLFCCDASAVAPSSGALDWNKRREEIQQRLAATAQSVIPVGDGIWTTKSKTNTITAVDSDSNDLVQEILGLSGYRSQYADEKEQGEMEYGNGESFVISRFQSPACIRKAFDSVRRSASSFKWFESKDGRRKGYTSSTKLGGDYVLAEAEQLAINCTTEDVLRVYLSGELQARWNSENIMECHFTKCKQKNSSSSTSGIFGSGERKKDRQILQRTKKGDHDNMDDEAYFYRQDLLLRSQRVIRTHTGPMKYQQTIDIDKIGRDNYSVLVRLNKKDSSPITASAKKPFESLQVYVGLEQMGKDVKIYAAGVFEVNREVVPKILVFDASGFAGSLAGKGTLWLAGYFEETSRREQQSGEVHLKQ